MHSAQQQKHIKIFLSSTFTDMHAERDVIMNQVYPAVSHILSPKNITVQFVDLRWGVNTQDVEETEREKTVLEECISEIQSSRPFFIGLLGNRYGWIPPQESWGKVLDGISEKDPENKIVSEISSPKSVTELEILFGVLHHSHYLRRSIFCLRKEEVYQKIDSESLKKYSDTDEEAQHKLAALKSKIINSYEGTGYEKNLYEYPCEWDGEKITGLENLVGFLTEAIVKEVMLYECSEENMQAEDEYQPLFIADFTKIEKNTESFVGREGALHEIPEAFSEKINTIILTSHDGFGKTALISQLYKIYSAKPDVAVFVHFSDKKNINHHPETILKKWLADEHIVYDRKFSLQQDIDFPELAFHFKKAVSSLNKKVILLIDDIHLLKSTDTFLDFSWIPENVYLIASADDSWEMNRYETDCFLYYPVPYITVEEAKAITEKQLKLKGKKLPSSAMEALLNHSYKNFRSSSSPLWIKLMVRRLTYLSAEDYRKIAECSEKDEALKIQNYLIELIKQAHPQVEPLFLSLIEQSPYFHGSDFMWHIVKFIAATENGIREADLQAILKEIWDNLAFTSIKNWLGDLIKIDNESGLIDFEYEAYRVILRLPEESMKPYNEVLARYLVDLKKEKNSGIIADTELPYLALKLKSSHFMKDFPKHPTSYLWTQTVNAATHYFLRHSDHFLEWYKEAINLAPSTSIRLSLDMAMKIMLLHRQNPVIDLFEYMFQNLPGEYNNCCETNQCRILTAELLQPGYPELAEKLVTDFLNENVSEQETDPETTFLIAKAARILSDIHFAKGEPKDAYDYMRFAVSKFEQLLFLQGKYTQTDELKKAFEKYIFLCKEVEPDRCDELQQYYQTVFAAEQWMYSHYTKIEPQLRQAGFSRFSNDDFCSDLLFHQVLKQAEQLTLYAPDNILFRAAYIHAKLCRYRLNDTPENHTEEIETDFDTISAFISEEMEDLSAQCLLYLHQTDAERYNRDFVLDYLKEKVNLDQMMKSTNIKVLATLYQIIILFKLNPDHFFNDTDVNVFLKIAENLLLSRNDVGGAAYFNRRYSNTPKETQPTDILEIKSNVLRCLIAAKQGDFNTILDYYEVVKTFMKAIPTVESFIAVNDFMRIWALMLQQNLHEGDSRLNHSFQIFSDLLNVINHTEENYDDLLRLQLCFYNFCSQADYSVLPFLREGKLDKAETLLQNLQSAISQMKKTGQTNQLVLTAFSLAYSVYSAYYEETRFVPEALYWSKMLENTVFENYRQYPGDHELKRRYAAAADNSGRLFLTYSISFSEAENSFNRAFHLFQELYAEKKSGIIVNDMLISVHNLMQTLYHKKEYNKAITFANNFLETLDLNDAFVELRVVATLYDDLSDHYIAVGAYEKASEVLLKSQEIFVNQLQTAPENELYLRDFAQNGIRMALFAWEKKNELSRALEIMAQVDEKLLKASEILDSSMKIRQMYVYFLYRYSQMLIAAHKPQEAVLKLNLFINVCYHEIKNEKNLLFVPFLWDGINLNFNESLPQGYIDIASDLTGMELKLKKEFIQEKIIKQEDIALPATMQKVEILEKVKEKSNNL